MLWLRCFEACRHNGEHDGPGLGVAGAMILLIFDVCYRCLLFYGIVTLLSIENIGLVQGAQGDQQGGKERPAGIVRHRSIQVC